MKLSELIAIDVHTHAEVSCRQEPDEAWKPFEEASAKYFKTGKRPTIAESTPAGTWWATPIQHRDRAHVEKPENPPDGHCATPTEHGSD